MRINALLAAAAISFGAVTAQAATTTIDFDALTVGTDITGLDLGGVALASLKKEDALRVSDLNPAPGEGNTIRTDSFRSIVRGAFSVSGVNSVSIDLGDFGKDADKMVLRVFDASKTLIGQDVVKLKKNEDGMRTLTVSASNIAYMAFGSVGEFKNSIYADNLVFSTEETTAIPLPAGFLLLGTALAGLGLVRRKSA